MYGPQGHRGTYTRGPFGSDPDKMLAYLIRLYQEGTLSEGQVAKATGLDRISIRRLGDEHRLRVEDAAQGIEARQGRDEGSVEDESPVTEGHAPDPKREGEMKKEDAA
jgi:hypothetical protein